MVCPPFKFFICCIAKRLTLVFQGLISWQVSEQLWELPSQETFWWPGSQGRFAQSNFKCFLDWKCKFLSLSAPVTSWYGLQCMLFTIWCKAREVKMNSLSMWPHIWRSASVGWSGASSAEPSLPTRLWKRRHFGEAVLCSCSKWWLRGCQEVQIGCALCLQAGGSVGMSRWSRCRSQAWSLGDFCAGWACQLHAQVEMQGNRKRLCFYVFLRWLWLATIILLFWSDPIVQSRP